MNLPRWAGAQVCILASGQSLTVEQCQAVRVWRDTEPVGRRAIVINNTYQLAHWADLLYACDATWWRVHIEAVRTLFHGELWTQDQAACELGVCRVESRRLPGLGRNPGLIHQGGNSGFQALNLAWQMGVSKAILLGFDMHGTHWHGKHIGLPNPQDWLMRQWVKDFAVLAADLDREGMKVVNCSPGSALDCFPRAELASQL